MIPFAVVGSDQEYQVNGRRLLGRKTKWGTIEGTTLVCIYINDALLAKKKRGKKRREGFWESAGHRVSTMLHSALQTAVVCHVADSGLHQTVAMKRPDCLLGVPTSLIPIQRVCLLNPHIGYALSRENV